jgi:cytochrome P450
MYPSIIYQIPRYVPAEGINIAGYDIPPGTAAGISALSYNRSKEIFGQDSNTFRPERWMEDEARAKQMDSLLATVILAQSLTDCSLDTEVGRVLGRTLRWLR